jgi:hypothetical protein
MGIVLEGRDPRLQRVVAIKVLAPQLAVTAIARQRFLREARAAAAVRDEHVVTIYAVEEADGLPYLVMELIAGLSLQERIDRNGPLELKEIMRIGVQTARGLSAAHAHGLIHRDVKPANILLENGVERVKLTDFGLARVVDDVSLTQSGVIAGTPQYMSPEQALGRTIDSRSDLFSLGSVLYAMCTGRSPFRAESTVAALRRVCDDSPRPICEINPDVPDWVFNIIGRLLAKQPDERFQSAQEVADLLSNRLAALQQPALPEVVLRSPQAKFERAHHAQSPASAHRWLIAAALLLAVIGSLGLTEATGVTQIVPTVIRVMTGEGTLLVEVDDPGVKVTIEGDGGLVIHGAGAQEVRLRPGSYHVQANKDGMRIPLERELVSIAQGGKEVVKVKLQQRLAQPPDPIALKGAFVVLSSSGANVRSFDALTDAVLGASDGDVIEVRGNGPFPVEPIEIGNRAITLRAGSGFRPSLELVSPQAKALLTSHAPIVLEGIEFVRRSEAPDLEDQPSASIVETRESELHIANCRFVRKFRSRGSCVASHRSARVEIHNSEFLLQSPMGPDGGSAIALAIPATGTLLIENCVGAGWYGSLRLYNDDIPVQQVSVRLRHNTWAMANALYFRPSSDSPQKPPLFIEAERNVFDSSNWFLHYKPETGPQAQPWAEIVPKMLAWRDAGSLYPTKISLRAGSEVAPPAIVEGIAAWDHLWDRPPPGSRSGRPKFQGGDLYAIAKSGAEQLKPEDFRLRPDSPGYRVGPDGKDLGADIDLVGPGEAYERWKKTPEYGEWQRETGQLRAEGPKAEPKAFVVLGNKVVAERKFDSLADAVLNSSDGDIIEVRGKGPFLTQPITINRTLTVRAGQGFRPVIELTPERAETQSSLITTHAPFVLEGLEFKARAPKHLSPQVIRDVVVSHGAPLYVANCRFVAPNQDVISAHVPLYLSARNCEFLSSRRVGVKASHHSGIAWVVDNCLFVADSALAITFLKSYSADTRIRVTRNSMFSRYGIWFEVSRELDFAKTNAVKPAHVDASDNVFDTNLAILRFEHGTPLEAPEAEALVHRLLDWSEQRNLYAVGSTSVQWSVSGAVQPFKGPASIAEWNHLWKGRGTDSLENRIRYQGGDLLGKLEATPEQLTPNDFHLREGSAGYRAGPDGKDLGADIDLVGPGAAYERWKQLPEYQEWLKETRQVK